MALRASGYTLQLEHDYISRMARRVTALNLMPRIPELTEIAHCTPDVTAASNLFEEVNRSALFLMVADSPIPANEGHIALLTFAGVQESILVLPSIKAVTVLLAGWSSEQQDDWGTSAWADPALA